MRHLFVKIGIFFINCLANATFKTAKSRTGVSQVKSSLYHHTLKSTQAENSEKPMRSSRSNCIFQQYLTVTGIKLSSSLTNKKEL